MKRHIPNFLTLLNLSSGVFGLVFIIRGETDIAIYLVFLSGLLDFMDGFTARLLNAFSELGKSLDSLADVISFGVLPAMIAFSALSSGNTGNHVFYGAIPYFALLIPAFSAVRLAIFNTDNNQSLSFKGLPTPANAFMISSAVYIFINQKGLITLNKVVLLIIILFGCLLMVSRFRMFSLKLTQSAKGSKVLITLYLFASILLIIFLGIEGIFLSILLYIVISLFNLIKT